MFVPKNLAELNQMITEGMEESINLEYKSADALKNNDNCKKEIAKDVSAMANSAGGVIIYGVNEFGEKDKRHLPEKITPINRIDFSKEQLEHIIQSNISPRIENLIIHPITLENPNEAVYVVEIPQSTTAHQNTRDQRYYKRYNFEAVPMLDYEIKDIMNRSRHPFVVLEFEIEKNTYDVGKRLKSSMLYDPFTISKMQGKYKTEYSLTIFPKNKGSVYSKYVSYSVQLPINIVDPKDIEFYKVLSSETIEFYGENTYRDVVDYKLGSARYGPSRFDPILPGLRGCSKTKLLNEKITIDEREITWEVHADNAAPVTGRIKLCDMPLIEKTERENEDE